MMGKARGPKTFAAGYLRGMTRKRKELGMTPMTKESKLKTYIQQLNWAIGKFL